MTSFSKRSQAEAFFAERINELRQAKVKAIFCDYPPSYNHCNSYRVYESESNLYILLENGKCLVIHYHFIDDLSVDYRLLTQEELANHKASVCKDCFHATDYVYCDRTLCKIARTDTVSLDYGCITDISLSPITGEYDAWINGQIERVKPTEETFCEILFTMDNGKSFTVCPNDAWSDGYVLFWSEDAEEKSVVYD